MSRTKPVGLGEPGREMWVYDAALSILLADVVRAVAETPEGRRPSWWPDVEHELRVHAVVSDLYLDLRLGLDDDQREQLARLFEDAAARLASRPPISAAEAAGWVVLDGEPVVLRGTEPVDTAPVAELGQALAALLRGSLEPAPPGTWWFYGAPGGRRTIGMRA